MHIFPLCAKNKGKLIHFETMSYIYLYYNYLFFRNHFEELQTVLFDVELVINNAPLTYVYLNTIETCLKPNHLLFGRQFLYFSNTASTLVTNLSGLSNTTDKPHQ